MRRTTHCAARRQNYCAARRQNYCAARRQNYCAALLLAAGLLIVGCYQVPAPPPTPPPVPPVVVKAAPPPVTTVADSSTPPAAAPAEEPKKANETAAPAAAPVEARVEPPPTFARERILLLAPHNPIVIEFQLTIDGAPHTAALQRLVGEVLKLVDADGDGRVAWKDLCANSRIKYGQFGNLAIEGENSEKQIVERYDIDKDGIVDDTELPRFLTRNAGGSRPFSIRGTADYRGSNRRHAPTWQSIDADGNGEISAEERAAAAARLIARDGNDDEILLPSELNPRALTLDPRMMSENTRRRGPDAARMLGPHADWGSVALSLETEYGGSSILRAGCFPLTPELFTQLDADRDGRLARGEFAALNDVEPHLVVAVEFGKAAEQESGVGGQESEDQEPVASGQEPEGGDAQTPAQKAEPRIRVVSAAPALAGAMPQIVEQPGRLTIAIGGVLLTLYTNDTVASEDFAGRAKQALAMYDNNKDGYLVKEEVPENLQAQFGRFEAIDADEDGKAFAAEIEAFLTQQQAGLRAQIHAKASDREDVLFAALDADRDERLDSREVEAAAQRLAALDKNADDLVTSDELPELMVIGLARGSLENPEATFTPPPVAVRGPAGDAPRWFTAMDANSDGAISRREFLGTAEKFAELDADANGLLELGEATR